MQARASVYRERQVMTASPIERIVIVYDVVLTACGVQDMERALRGLSLLRGALDWEAAPEIAPRLQAIYEYCEECIRSGDYRVPRQLLRELRETWVEARAALATTAQPNAPSAALPGSVGVGTSALNIAG